ncbi:hypothetical protein J0H33_06255 [bacterium]|nr:hypothetical protein [bacterium]
MKERDMSTHAKPDGIWLDPETASFIRGIKKQAVWWLCPFGAWTERNGSGVIFDRAYRPIIRVMRGGATEIVPPDEFISYRRQRYFHRGFGWSPDIETREIVTQIIAKYDLAPELRRRRDLLRRGELPRCDWLAQKKLAA